MLCTKRCNAKKNNKNKKIKTNMHIDLHLNERVRFAKIITNIADNLKPK